MPRLGRMFRMLRADEIEARVGTDFGDDITLLLYKDARADMNILDETVGPMHWKRQHSRDNANCMVSILDTETGEWIGKEDTGVESRTQAEKGLASDSFKRACTNWGIGRQLYESPDIRIAAADVYRNKQGKVAMKFAVVRIEYADDSDKINALDIANARTGKIIFSMDKPVTKAKPVEKRTEVEKAKPKETVTVSDKVPATPQSILNDTVIDNKKLQRRAAWKNMANANKVTSKELQGMYEQFIASGVLPNIPLADLDDAQFDAMIQVFSKNVKTA